MEKPDSANPQFEGYPFIIAGMAVLQVCATLYGRRFIDLLGFNIGEGLLILLPILLYIFQITSECYGWQYARQLIWCNFVVNLILVGVTFSFRLVPISNFAHANLKYSYTELIDTMWIPAAINWVTVFFANLVTATLMCWSRFHLQSRFAILRILICHCIGEIILLSGILLVLPYYGYSINAALKAISASLATRGIAMIVLLPVAIYVIWYIKHKIDRAIVIDVQPNFNPFKFGIDNSKISIKQI
jgi:uncharacterized PurR-regulated membrane protein YhhQ (DUF165 family)